MIFTKHNNHPVVSIIILLYNQLDKTKKCLQSILDTVDIEYELILINNNSVDGTKQFLNNIYGAKKVNNQTNLGFGGGCNQGAKIASGKYLLFLNNDTEVNKDTVPALLKIIENKDDIGVVGGKIVFPDGTLQEAGNKIFPNGSCKGYGRLESPEKPEYNYLREVDFVSGALLLTPKELFIKLDMFDKAYYPAYYEDVDYCMKVIDSGLKVYYQPESYIIHHEHGSSNKEKAQKLMIRNRDILLSKWKRKISYPNKKLRILFVEDNMPCLHFGSGFPRANNILNRLLELGYDVTFFPISDQTKYQPITSEFQQKGAEMIYATDGIRHFEEFISRRANYYDVLLVSRPHNISKVAVAKKYGPNIKIIYDAEAIFAMRQIEMAKVLGKPLSRKKEKILIEEETKLTNGVDLVLSVSKNEANIFFENTTKDVEVLGFELEPKPTPNRFNNRKGLLFVGTIRPNEPNEDSLLYFAKEIMPKLDYDLYIVGNNMSQKVFDLASDKIKVIGKVDNLEYWYNTCRVFIIPTRFAAGIPYKYYEASACGIPSVVSCLIGKQLSGLESIDMLIGKDCNDFIEKTKQLYRSETLWNTIRNGAIKKIHNECSHKNYVNKISQSINKVLFCETEIIFENNEL